ncbi:bifunctional acetate--CoA ligase family protein/GNAT family N-acetyltransferase [Nitrosococcus wardiae]|uniref:Bifunctional acyl-CoA synthetase/GNAT family N-acetyltransferase n=1 Tax=Nitrosococcus wardiae TaxID=1814290 RepID=A0A4P7C211_9GAMM|nr:bifunctional acetate--CoA ligase family protein/GNAT family N-acetyltransferase [Nitrosococcus wardiae]QBQ55697.1 bifunctional acyl-CoA synthetase/GNAT family N-acetyltransferase [Nitrosococcus wardiae]
MSIRNLEHLFQPQSVAVIGASTKPHSVGGTVMRNLLEGGFGGPIMPVNPKYRAVAGVLAYPNIASLPETPDLAIIGTPPTTVPGLITELGERGTKAAIVLTAGLPQTKDKQGQNLQQKMLEAARPHLLRILGPNCVGLMIPLLGFNGSFAHTQARKGEIAFVSQSGALTTVVLDWAKSKDIGFSYFISMGDSADIDFGDVLDYLGGEPNTRAILLYIESIKEARKFMSAARAAARNKPVLVVKSGRAPEGAQAAASHTGALAGSDDVYSAAIRRAGMLRVVTIENLFGAVETLARALPMQGNRLTILTNGGGPGVMATDAVILADGQLATLSKKTIQQLDQVLPPTWSHGNPVDIIGDAPAERYVKALKILLNDPQSDALLLIHAPTAIVPSDHIAEAIVTVVKEAKRNVLTCWLGGEAVEKARDIFARANIPTYGTPEEAVHAFLNMVEYHRNQVQLMETPPSISQEFTPDRKAAQQVIKKVLASSHRLLSEPQAKEILATYGIPVVATRVAKTPEEAQRMAQELGFPVALKILSPDISHKSDVGGVVLDLETPEAVQAEAERILRRLQELRPEAQLEGFTVQEMAHRPGAHELLIGATTDPIFGPIILFGQGGTAVEIIQDRAVALPPLNMHLAQELISRTRVAKLLAGYRDRPAVDQEAIARVLIQIAELIADIPEITELDINPLLADDKGVLALDARMGIAPAKSSGPERLAIRPYPRELEEWSDFQREKVLLRPIRPEDEPQYREFLQQLDPQDIRFRFFDMIKEWPHSELARYTQIDYDREMAFLAIPKNVDDWPKILGVARAITDPLNIQAEFAIIVHSALKGKGLGHLLLDKMIQYYQSCGTKELIGNARRTNQRMLALAKDLGFEIQPIEEEIVQVRLNLQS